MLFMTQSSPVGPYELQWEDDTTMKGWRLAGTTSSVCGSYWFVAGVQTLQVVFGSGKQKNKLILQGLGDELQLFSGATSAALQTLTKSKARERP